MIKKLKEGFLRLVLREEGGKKVVRLVGVFAIVLFCAVIAFAVWLYFALTSKPDSSHLKKSDVPLTSSHTQTTAKPNQVAIGGVTDQKPNAPERDGRHRGRRTIVNYRARQVISPADGSDHIESGANFIGKLLSQIDTRSTQPVLVTLPFGGRAKNGNSSLPPGTNLVGQISYPGQGERVFVSFDHGTLPDGSEIALHATALSSKDFSPGLLGEFHSNTGNRMASVLGLSMISGMSEVMVEKEGLGQTFEPTPKATLKNGFYNGLSKVTEGEANTQAAKLGETPEYATVDEGSDLIVSLTGGFSPKNGQHD